VLRGRPSTPSDSGFAPTISGASSSASSLNGSSVFSSARSRWQSDRSDVLRFRGSSSVVVLSGAEPQRPGCTHPDASMGRCSRRWSAASAAPSWLVDTISDGRRVLRIAAAIPSNRSRRLCWLRARYARSVEHGGGRAAPAFCSICCDYPTTADATTRPSRRGPAVGLRQQVGMVGIFVPRHQPCPSSPGAAAASAACGRAVFGESPTSSRARVSRRHLQTTASPTWLRRKDDADPAPQCGGGGGGGGAGVGGPRVNEVD